MDCAQHKTSDGEQRESRQVSERTTGDWQRTGRRKCSKQPEARKQNIETVSGRAGRETLNARSCCAESRTQRDISNAHSR